MADEKKNTVVDEDVKDQTTDETGMNENDSNEDNNDNQETGDKGSNKGGKTFTQEQVTRMMTREKQQGRNSILKELGLKANDTKTMAQVKAYLESLKSDEQKNLEAENEANEKLIEAENRALVAEAKAEAMMLGIKSQFVDDAVTLALSKMTEDSDLKTIIGELKTKYPIWFGNSSEDEKDKGKGDDKSKKTGQRGTGSSVGSKDKGSQGDNKGLGARLAAQRKTSGKKASFWGQTKQ